MKKGKTKGKSLNTIELRRLYLAEISGCAQSHGSVQVNDLYFF